MRLREPGAFKRSRRKKEVGHYYNGVIAACASGEEGAVSKVGALVLVAVGEKSVALVGVINGPVCSISTLRRDVNVEYGLID